MLDAIVIDPADHVGTALRDLPAAAAVVPRGPAGAMLPVVLVEPIAVGHKFALMELAVGVELRKYGEVIGVTTVPIAAGGHVHVHNLASRRARSVGRVGV